MEGLLPTGPTPSSSQETKLKRSFILSRVIILCSLYKYLELELFPALRSLRHGEVVLVPTPKWEIVLCPATG